MADNINWDKVKPMPAGGDTATYEPAARLVGKTVSYLAAFRRECAKREDGLPYEWVMQLVRDYHWLLCQKELFGEAQVTLPQEKREDVNNIINGFSHEQMDELVERIVREIRS